MSVATSVKPNHFWSGTGAVRSGAVNSHTAFTILRPVNYQITQTNYGTFVPKNFRPQGQKFHRVELSLPGTFVVGDECSMELSFDGTFVPGDKNSWRICYHQCTY